MSMDVQNRCSNVNIILCEITVHIHVEIWPERYAELG